MTVESNDQVRYGTRWGRMLVFLLPVVLVIGGIGASLSKGIIAASVVAQSTDANLVTKGLRGDGIGLIIAPQAYKLPNGQVTSRFVRRIGVARAVVNGLCLAQPVRIAGQAFTVMIVAGDKDPSTFEVSADGVILDVNTVKGYVGTTGNTAVNKNAADVQVEGSTISLDGSPDSFGLQSTKVDLRDINAQVQDIVVPNSLATPSFTVNLMAGSKQCPPPGS